MNSPLAGDDKRETLTILLAEANVMNVYGRIIAYMNAKVKNAILSFGQNRDNIVQIGIMKKKTDELVSK